MPLRCLLLSVVSDMPNEERDSEDEWEKLSLLLWLIFFLGGKNTQY